MHGARLDPEGQAHLAVHVPVEERLHLLRERPPAGPIPARDRDHEGLRRRLESRGRRRPEPPHPIPTPITPPPQPTGRTENPASCLFYSCHERRGPAGSDPCRGPVDKAANRPSSDGAAGPLRTETVDNFLKYGRLGWSGSPWTVIG